MTLSPLRTYYRGADLVAMRDHAAGQHRYYHFDHQGTTQCLTNAAGAVTDTFASDAWGVQVKRTGTSINRQWYVGNLGSYSCTIAIYSRDRYFAPILGVWASRDRMPNGHPYLYASNGPALRVDPAGLSDCSILDFKGEWMPLQQGVPSGPTRQRDGRYSILLKRMRKTTATVKCTDVMPQEQLAERCFWQWVKVKGWWLDARGVVHDDPNASLVSPVRTWQWDTPPNYDARGYGTYRLSSPTPRPDPDHLGRLVFQARLGTCDAPGWADASDLKAEGCVQTFSPVMQPRDVMVDQTGRLLGLKVSSSFATGVGASSLEGLKNAITWGVEMGWGFPGPEYNNGAAFHKTTGGSGKPAARDVKNVDCHGRAL